MVKINSSEITPEHIYISRRKFIKGVGALVASSLVLGACDRLVPAPTPLPVSTGVSPRSSTDELGQELTSYQAIAN
jgi:sulfoxide reductase catalytic subunit YedY